MDGQFKIAIIGLGLIGGSLAYALHGFRDGVIVGCDNNGETRANAEKKNAVDVAVSEPREAMKDADLIILCTYPESIPDIVKENCDYLKPGAVITDVCGIKGKIAPKICRCLPPDVDYVGGHPMAGTEHSGFSNASGKMFVNTGFLITPKPNAKASAIALIREMAEYIGADKISVTTYQEHDSVIAYTSDLMHIAASGLCLSYHPSMNLAFTAGAFRDCTRIAKINPELWTELFLSNRNNILREIQRYQDSLERMKEAIQKEDAESLQNILKTVAKNKERMSCMEP